MRNNKLKEAIRKGEISVGMEVWTQNPSMVEILGLAGFNFVWIENEHSNADWNLIQNLVRTAELVGITPLMRIEDEYNSSMVRKALENGIQGIIFPHVNTKEDAIRAVRVTKFPPEGIRGVASIVRSASFGTPPEKLLDYVRQCKEETIVWTHIEEPKGVENVDEILSIKGVDIAFFGSEDYAVFAGLDPRDPAVREARQKVMDAAKRRGVTFVASFQTLEELQDLVNKGIRVFVCGADQKIFYDKCKEIMKIVKKVKPPTTKS